MMTNHTLKVRTVKKETEDCVSITFEASCDDMPYKSGQYLTILVDMEGKVFRRCYSLCSSPATDKALQIAVKKVVGGRVSSWLNESLEAGDTMQVRSPEGRFFIAQGEALPRHVVFIAGGSGITPVFSMLKTVMSMNEVTKTTLIYANRNEEQIIFKSEIKALAESHPERLDVIHILDDPGYFQAVPGPATVQVMQATISRLDAPLPGRWYLCGPAPMMANTMDVLRTCGVDEEKIRREYFTADESSDEVVGDDDPEINSEVTVVVDGDESTFELSSKGKAILEAALDAGIDVPFSCKGGVCCTCKAKVMSGAAVMDKNFALSKDEVAQGYILTCQAHPGTSEIEVDYDEIY